MIFGKAARYSQFISLNVTWRILCRYKSIGQVVKTLYKSGGPKAFLNGLGPTLVRAFPANAATFFAYEMAMDCMKGL